MTESESETTLLTRSRIAGALLTLTLLLASAGNTSAAIAATFSGP
ncbi:DUF7503 family protein [Halarchaeum acidiphilum]|nr:hypothetical protein [Halarchaeum acidiphilum]